MIAGQTFGRLTLVRILDQRAPDKHILGLWRCECGTETSVAISRVKNGYAKSCGCLGPELSRVRARKHGMRDSKEYSSWGAMKSRCLDPANKDYPRWGGKGVTICAEWVESFEVFFAHIGPRPPGTTLDRIDNTKNYEPGNVRWASSSEQAANRSDSWRVHIAGNTYDSVDHAARALAVSGTTIIRWCDGYVDPRRSDERIPAKPGCWRWRAYAG